MSTSRKIAVGSIARVSHMALVTIAGFFMMPFLVGHLGEHWYGIWVAVGSLGASYYLIDFGLASAVMRFVTMGVSKADAVKVNQVINTALRVYLVLALILVMITGVLVFLSPRIIDATEDARLIQHVVLVVGLTLAVGFPFKAFAGVAQAYYRDDLLTAVNIGGMLVQLLGAILVIALGYGILGLAYVGLLSSVVSDVLLVWMVRHLFPGLKFSGQYFQRDMVRELFAYSSWSFVTQVADQIRLRIDALVIATLINASAVTHYFVGARLAELTSTLLFRATNIGTPLLTRLHGQGRHQDMRDAVFFLTRLNVAGGVFAAGGLYFLGGAFIARWMGPEFLDTVPVLLALTAAFTAGFIVLPLDNLLYAVAKHKVLAIINIGDAVANLSLSLLLGKWFGLAGVAMGTAIPMLVTRLFLVAPYGCSQLRLPIHAYFMELARSLAVAVLIMGLLGFFASFFAVGGGYPRIVGLGSLLAVAYIPGAWFLVLRKEDRKRILALLGTRRPLRSAESNAG